MNKFKQDIVKQELAKGLSPSEAYDVAQTAWKFFRFERDEKRLLLDLTGRLTKLLVRVDKFIEDNKEKLSPSMIESLNKSKTEINRESSKGMDEDVKKLFKVLNAAVIELNNSKKDVIEGQTNEETK